MALIVENGTGLANAQSYCSVAQATAYHAARNNLAWDAVDEQEAALIKATDYMQQTYNGRWKGLQLTQLQALDWPRVGVMVGRFLLPYSTIPVEVINACAELALRAATGDLLPDVGAQVTSETVGPISVSYAIGARQTTSYKSVDNLLARYMTGGGAGSIPVVRA